MKNKSIILILFVLILCSFVYADSVRINEIMYNPSNELGGTYNEWIELYNPTDSQINLTNWKIADPSNHSLEILTSAIIESKGYFILAKKPENLSQYYNITCPIAKVAFSLNNNGEEIFLKNFSGDIIDSLNYSSTWGANGNGKTLEFNGSWYESLNINGTPGAVNSIVNEESDNLIGELDNVSTNIDNLNMTVNGSGDLLQIFSGEQLVEFKDDGVTIIEFMYDFSNYVLNLSNIEINKRINESYGYLVVKGISLTNTTKIIYIDDVNESNKICIKDEEISSISEISSYCNNITNEFLVVCNNSLQYNRYTCENLGNQYKVSGLTHSGIKEMLAYCGDGSCDSNEDCSSCANDCRSCNPGVSSSRRRSNYEEVLEEGNITEEEKEPVTEILKNESLVKKKEEKAMSSITGHAITQSKVKRSLKTTIIAILIIIVVSFVIIYLFTGFNIIRKIKRIRQRNRIKNI